MVRFLLTALLGWVLTSPALAQREYSTWCMGYDTIPPRQVSYYTQYGRGAQIAFGAGGARTVGFCHAANNSIADAQGNLLFYTNGTDLFDRRHQPLPGGAGLADATDVYCVGQDVGQALNNVLVPAPGQAGLYYVFYFRRPPPHRCPTWLTICS